jgi:hypothetical protein
MGAHLSSQHPRSRLDPLDDDRKVNMSGIRIKVASVGATVVMTGATLLGTVGTAAAATPTTAPTANTATISATQLAPEWRRCNWWRHHYHCWGGGWDRWHSWRRHHHRW